MTRELQILTDNVCTLNFYRYPPIIKTQLQKIANNAHSFGYCFDHWQATGQWRKYEELPKLNATETEQTQADIIENMPIQAIPVGKSLCETCHKPMQKTRNTQRFCSTKCKNAFHNLNKKKISNSLPIT